MDLIIKTQIDASVQKTPSARLFAMRTLSRNEMRWIRKAGIKRLYLLLMVEESQKEFFKSFDAFWDNLIKDYPLDHFFWRNVISSKMQEWECSLVYFLLVLFTLTKSKKQNESPVLLLVSSFEEAEICRWWAIEQRWNVMASDGKFKMCFLQCFQELRSVFYFGYSFLSVCQRKFFLPKFKNIFQFQNDSKNILIATLSYPNSFNDGQYQDPFFGDFQNRLKDFGYKSLYITDLLAKIDTKTSRAIDSCTSNPVQVVCSVLSWWQVIKIFFKLFFRRIKVKQAYFVDIDISKLVEWNFRRFTHGFNISAEIFFEAIKKTCRDYDFNKLVLLFEGNVFERACIQAFRQCSKGDICGYSHASIFDLNLRLHLTSKEKYNRPEPDYFVCSGLQGKRLLQEVSTISKDKVREGCTLRRIPKVQVEKTNNKISKTILIALEGIWISNRLLDWIIDCSDLFVNYDVIVRSHPNISIEKVLQQTIGLLPKNFRISHGSLDMEIKESLCVLYRHSSVGMQALLNGVPAIHLSVDAPLSADPLKELNKGKWTVYDRHDLQEALSHIELFRAMNNERVVEEASQYVQEYFSVPTDERIKQFIGQQL